MPQIKIEHDIGDTVYVVTQTEDPRTVVEGKICRATVNVFVKDTLEVSYRVGGISEMLPAERIFKDPRSAFNPDAPRAVD